MPTLKCPTCHNDFFRRQSYLNDKLKNGVKNFYCSKKCYNTAHASKECFCSNCNKSIIRTKADISRNKSEKFFCSHSCAASFNNKGNHHNPPKKRTCVCCKQEYYKQRKISSKSLCPNCYKNKLEISELYKNKTIKDIQMSLYSEGKIHPSWKSVQIRNFNRSWNKNLLQLPCQKCGYDKHIELCHIIPIQKFDENTKLKVVNAPENNLVLCGNHHWEFDNNILKLKDIPKHPWQD